MGIFQNGKNLIPNEFITKEANGVTAQTNSDKSITFNGTATKMTDFYIFGSNSDKGKYIKLPKGSKLFEKYEGVSVIIREKTLGAVIGKAKINETLKEQDCYAYGMFFRADVGGSYNNTTYYPMIHDSSIVDVSYEPYYSGKSKLFAGDKKVKKAYLGTEKIYSAGNIVTYCVDNGVTYQEEVDSDASCLSPTTFTPSKSGWTFVGWREDATARSDVLSSKIMGDEPITLYAVFKKDVTVYTYDDHESSNDGAPYEQYGTVYYNNGNILAAEIEAYECDAMYSTFRGYARFSSYKEAKDNIYPSYTPDVFEEEMMYITEDTYLVALYSETITLTYYNNSTTKSTKTGTRYIECFYLDATDPTFTISQASKSGMTARGWSTSNVGNGAITYNNNTAFTRDSNITLYGLYQQTITVTYYNNSTTAKTTTGTRYWAPAGYINPSFTLSQSAKSGWGYRGWSTSNAADANTSNNITYGGVDVQNTTFTRDSNITLYGIYYQTVSLTYNGNGASSGSVDGYWTWRIYNSSNRTYNPTTTLRANGFSRMDYSFNGWNLGAVGATVTLDGDKVAYAQWKQLSLTLFNGGTFYHNFDILTEYEDTDGLGDGEYASYNKNNGLYMAAYAYYYRIAWVTTSKIDVTNLKTLNFNISGITSVGDATWMIGLQSTRKVTKAWDNNDAYNGGYGNTLSAGTISLDVSGLSGSYYVIIQIDSCNRKTLGFTATKGWFDAK